MNTTSADKVRVEMPSREVTPRETSFPVLSIAYRTFAQLEIWCMDGGGKWVDAYCKEFEWQGTNPKPDPEGLKWVSDMLKRGKSNETAIRQTIDELVENIYGECRRGGSKKIAAPDLKRKFPSLTLLYHHYVLGGHDEAEAQSVESLREGVFRDLYCLRLIW